MKPRNFINDGYYHVGNRAIGGMKLFGDLRDQLHFLTMLTEFNTTSNVEMRFAKTKAKLVGMIPGLSGQPLIDIIAYCLMPNHFHIIVRQRTDHGVTKYMHKLGTGYTLYFNTRHESSGHLFQSKFFSQHITSDEQLLHTTAYVHLNPVKRKNGSISNKNLKEHELYFLKNYQWSSLSDYNGDTSLQDAEIRLIKPKVNKSMIISLLQQKKFDYWRYITELWAPDIYSNKH
ncbi:MAG: transposase, partial [Candidatus Kerfeldbacteria bacterium]|nr:transposase [Candidatus Kerfeldbacteria bacterium]